MRQVWSGKHIDKPKGDPEAMPSQVFGFSHTTLSLKPCDTDGFCRLQTKIKLGVKVGRSGDYRKEYGRKGVSIFLPTWQWELNMSFIS